MLLAELSATAIEKIRSYRWDRIIEKHEGPEAWLDTVQYGEPEFLQIESHAVLLPIDREHHPNVSILRCISSVDGRSLTIFIKDTSYVENPDEENFQAGFLAICDKVPGEDFFLAIAYHEWFLSASLKLD